jgi:[acyl-carrier-protein] S-malonyltransferase
VGLAKRALPGVRTLALKTPDDLDAARALAAELGGTAQARAE